MAGKSPSAASADLADIAGGNLRDLAQRVIDSKVLGRSQVLEPLFLYLLACTMEGRAPKELEISDAVFGRSAANGYSDASVRVHMHRLRRKLDEYYAEAGRHEQERLFIPKADYRLTLDGNPAFVMPDTDSDVRPLAPGTGRDRKIMGLFGALLAFAVVLTWFLASRPGADEAELIAVRESALWNPVLANGRRVTLVLGDYYIFGERDKIGGVKRLVREFDVNSAADLAQLEMEDPSLASRYADLSLNYLPLGIGDAMRLVAPVIPGNREDVSQSQAFPASQLSPEFVKGTNIVYLGYLSGLGTLRGPMFSGSRFTVGDSYDEIVDQRTGRHYLADSHLGAPGDQTGKDYAIISAFPGVSGNRVVVIAGTRDAALMQAADFATRPETVADMVRQVKGSRDFDALLAIESLKNVGLRAQLVTVSPRPARTDWSERTPANFPDQLRH